MGKELSRDPNNPKLPAPTDEPLNNKDQKLTKVQTKMIYNSRKGKQND